MSPYFTISNGVRQGRICMHLIMYFYADDLCLMAPCAMALQELINVCY